MSNGTPSWWKATIDLLRKTSTDWHTYVAFGLGFTLAMAWCTVRGGATSRQFGADVLAQVAGGAVLLVIGIPLVRRQIMSQYWFNRKADVYSEIVRHLTILERWAELSDRSIQGDFIHNETAQELTELRILEGVHHASERRLEELRYDSLSLPPQAREDLAALGDYRAAFEESDGYTSTGWAFGYWGVFSGCRLAVMETARQEIGAGWHLEEVRPSPLRESIRQLHDRNAKP